MLGESIKVESDSFKPFLPDAKEGYHELKQIKPGCALCPFCDKIIDARQSKELKATVDAIAVWPRSWASVPICKCPGVWAVYDPNDGKWAFRYQIPTEDRSVKHG